MPAHYKQSPSLPVSNTFHYTPANSEGWETDSLSVSVHIPSVSLTPSPFARTRAIGGTCIIYWDTKGS